MNIQSMKALVVSIILFVCIAGISSRLCAQTEDLDAVMYNVGMLMLQEKYYEAIREGSPYTDRIDITTTDEKESMIGLLRALSHAYLKTGQRFKAEKTASALLTFPEANSDNDVALSILISVYDTFTALEKYTDAQKVLERIRTISEKK